MAIAQPEELIQDPGVVPKPKRVIATYYGTQASTNPENPCKGATIRVCAQREETAYPNTGTWDIEKTLKDEDGNIISMQILLNVPNPVLYLQRIALSLPENAVLDELSL